MIYKVEDIVMTNLNLLVIPETADIGFAYTALHSPGGEDQLLYGVVVKSDPDSTYSVGDRIGFNRAESLKIPLYDHAGQVQEYCVVSELSVYALFDGNNGEAVYL